MSRKKKETLIELLDRAVHAELAAQTADIQSMSKADLLESTLDNYSKLQRLWVMLLHQDPPCWQLLEQVSAEMQILEKTLEPLLRRCL